MSRLHVEQMASSMREYARAIRDETRRIKESINAGSYNKL